MYIGPWQEYKLAKLRKDAVDALKKLATLNLPSIENVDRNPDQTYNILEVLQAAANNGKPPIRYNRARTPVTSRSIRSASVSSHLVMLFITNSYLSGISYCEWITESPQVSFFFSFFNCNCALLSYFTSYLPGDHLSNIYLIVHPWILFRIFSTFFTLTTESAVYQPHGCSEYICTLHCLATWAQLAHYKSELRPYFEWL